MSDEKPDPVEQLLRAAKKAMDKLELDHFCLSGRWDDDEAMQIYEDLSWAVEDIEESRKPGVIRREQQNG